MEFFNPSVTFKGTVKADNAPINDTDLTRKQDIAGLSFITGIASGSSSMLSVADGELSLSNIAITDVHVDSTQTSLANFISNEGATAASLREGDVLILTAPSSGTETYIVSGANGSSAANYTQIESPLTAAEVGGVLQAGDGITVNAATAQISANIAAGAGLSSSVSSGQITLALSADSDDINEGSSNLYFTQARARQSIQADPASGNLLSYANASGDMLVSTASVRGVFSAGAGLSFSGGQYSFSGNTDIVGEGSSNLYFTQARARASISAGTGIAYTSGTGEIAINLVGGTAIGVSGNTISFNGSTSDVSEGTNQYFTQARARQSIQADPASGNLLSYANASGDMLVSTASVRGVFSAGTGLSFSGGQFALNATTNNVAEGTNLYYTDARVRAAVTTSSQSDELINYDSSNGTFSLRLQDIRHETSVTLTANVAATISHNLGKRLVHVSAMDSGGALVQLAVSYTNTNSLTVTSAVGVTVTVAISL